jgi:hypothetical protein
MNVYTCSRDTWEPDDLEVITDPGLLKREGYAITGPEVLKRNSIGVKQTETEKPSAPKNIYTQPCDVREALKGLNECVRRLDPMVRIKFDFEFREDLGAPRRPTVLVEMTKPV